jgi:uncharacterized Zn-binding protein involved in type VI secretion
MPPQGRLLDTAKQATHDHCCGVPHTVIGPAILGSDNVFVNKLPALRKGDLGIAVPCCGPNMWQADAGSGTVFINGKEAHRQGDATKHCGSFSGQLTIGSNNVTTGG